MPKTVERTTGSSGISIGTHLMLESLFPNQLEPYDATREVTYVDIKKYDIHIYNIYTIVRNIVNSITDNTKPEVFLFSKDFTNILEKEIELISSVYTKIQPVLFYPNYTDIYKHYNKNKDINITLRHKEHSLIRDSLIKVFKNTSIDCINNPTSYKLKNIKLLKDKSVLITTNLPVDLFNISYIPKLTLLESHTGKLKTKHTFNTKYRKTGKEDLTNLPYVEEILYILGDNNLVFPSSLELRHTLLECSKKGNWTSLTTRDKVIHDISKHSPTLRDYIKHFRRMYF